MLVVPFGRREVLGVVVGLAERSEIAEEKLLAPLRALELGVPGDLVALAEWIAAEYCSTISRALSLVLPPGAARRLSGRKRRAVTRRVHLPVGARSPEPPKLTAEQCAVLDDAGRGAHRARGARGPIGLLAAVAARRDRLRQDRDLPARRCDRAGAGARRDRARAGDRAHAADRRALRRTLRRHRRGAALPAAPGRALRGVAAPARGRGTGLRRPPLGRVRADRGSRPDRRRRGARRLLQARGRPPLRRPRRRRRARQALRGAAAAGQRHAPAGERPRGAPAAAPARPRRRPAAAAGARSSTCAARPRGCTR